MNTTEDGICRTILATYHKIGTYNVFEHQFPAVMEVYKDKDIALLDDYNQAVRGDDVIGAVTTTWGHSALRNGWKIIEIYESERDERGLPVQGEVHPGMGGALRQHHNGVLPGSAARIIKDSEMR